MSENFGKTTLPGTTERRMLSPEGVGKIIRKGALTKSSGSASPRQGSSTKPPRGGCLLAEILRQVGLPDRVTERVMHHFRWRAGGGHAGGRNDRPGRSAKLRKRDGTWRNMRVHRGKNGYQLEKVSGGGRSLVLHFREVGRAGRRPGSRAAATGEVCSGGPVFHSPQTLVAAPDRAG